MKKLAVLFIAWNLSFAAVALGAEDTFTKKSNQVEIILQKDRNNPKVREFVFLVGHLQRVKQEYLANKKAFKKETYKDGDSSFVQMSLDDVIQAELDSLASDSLIQPDFNNLGITGSLISLISHPIAQTIGGGLGILNENYPKDFYPPTTDSSLLHYDNIGDLTLQLSLSDDLIGRTLREKFKEMIGYEIESNLEFSSPVIEAKKEYTLILQNDYLVTKLGEMNNTLAKVEEKIAQVKAAEIEEKQKQLLLAKLEQEKYALMRNIVSSMQIGSTVFQMMGEEKLANQVSTIAKATEMIFEATKGGAYLEQYGTLAVVNVYLAAAMMIIDVIKTSGKPDQLGALIKSVQQLREEMHKRFDHVDDKLDEIFRRTDSGLRDIQLGVGRLEDNLAIMQNSLDDLNVISKLRISDLYDRYHNDDIALCMNSDFTPKYKLTDKDFTECLTKIDNNLLRYSLYRYDSISMGAESLDRATFDSLEFPYSAYLPRLVTILRDNFHAPIKSIELLRNPAVWNHHARVFEALWLKYPDLQLGVTDGNHQIQLAIESGEEINQAYESLALNPDDHKVNIELFKKLLKSYKELAVDGLNTINDLAYNNVFKIHPGKPLNQPLDMAPLTPPLEVRLGPGVPALKKDTIKGCEGSTDFGLHRLTVVSADLLGKPVEKKYEPYNHPDLKHSLGKIVEFPLWKDYHSSLPIELQWLESSKPGSVQFCFRKFNMIKLTIDTRKANPNHRAQFDIIVEVQFEGQTVLTSHFKPDIRHNWVYTVPSYGFPNPPAISTDIYKLYWNGAKEVTPIDKSMHFGFSGIVENNYKEATSWGNTFVENEVGMTFARATLLKNMESVKAEVIKDATSTEQFQIKRKALSEIRNALNIMIELGINSTSPERTLAQSKLYSLSRLSVETSSIERKANRELRELDVIMQQIMNGDYQTEEVLAQIDDASEEMITYFKKMNASGRDLCPVNRIIDTTLRDLRYLLRPEFKKAN